MIRFRDVLVALAVVAVASPAAARTPSPEDDQYLLTLGEHFYDSAQYYRAVGAFEELALFSTDAAVQRHARLRVAMAYHQGGQLALAVAAYDRLLASENVEGTRWGQLLLMRNQARAEELWSSDAPTPPADLITEIEPMARRGAPTEVHATYLLARLHLGEGRPDLVRELLAKGSARCEAAPEDECAALHLVTAALDIPLPADKSPVLGLGLSLVVPGLGAWYSGHRFDALYYFGLTAGAGLMAWDVHDGSRDLGDQKTSFYVLGGIAALFYASSAAQGWLGAQRHNEVARFHYRNAVLRATDAPPPRPDGLLP